MRCPTCKAAVAGDGKQQPFCSERCRLIDLGNWLGGTYRIAGERHVDEVSTPPEDAIDRDVEKGARR